MRALHFQHNAHRAGQNESPAIVVDRGADVIRIVERRRTSLERRLVEQPPRRGQLPDELGKVVPEFVVAFAAAFGRSEGSFSPLHFASQTSNPRMDLSQAKCSARRITIPTGSSITEAFCLNVLRCSAASLPLHRTAGTSAPATRVHDRQGWRGPAGASSRPRT